jgi:hypothetical protein
LLLWKFQMMLIDESANLPKTDEETDHLKSRKAGGACKTH